MDFLRSRHISIYSYSEGLTSSSYFVKICEIEFQFMKEVFPHMEVYFTCFTGLHPMSIRSRNAECPRLPLQGTSGQGIRNAECGMGKAPILKTKFHDLFPFFRHAPYAMRFALCAYRKYSSAPSIISSNRATYLILLLFFYVCLAALAAIHKLLSGFIWYFSSKQIAIPIGLDRTTVPPTFIKPCPPPVISFILSLPTTSLTLTLAPSGMGFAV